MKGICLRNEVTVLYIKVRYELPKSFGSTKYTS